MAKILVVDDYLDAAQSMALWLKLLGHDVQVASDGHQAIEIARRQRPNYVLLDIGLPGLDGYQVAAILRQRLGGRIVIIAITGFAREVDRRRALAAGCDYHLVKPVDHDALMELLSAPVTTGDTPTHNGTSTVAMTRESIPPLPAARDVEITNALGLHLRAADKFVRLAQAFEADIAVTCNGREANGKSILDLAALAAECGSRLEVSAQGSDAQPALDALAKLIIRRFDEDG